MSTPAPELSTEVQLPLRQRLDWGLPTPSDWLPELQQMRGRVLYDDGRRPAFRFADGSFADADAIDLDAYHVMVRYNRHVVACARVLVLAGGTRGVVAHSIGQDAADSLITELGDEGPVCEASRWIVAPDYRKQRLGFHIVAASWAISRWLGVRTALGMAGMRDGQHRLLMRMGGRAVQDVPIVTSDIYDDEMTLLAFDLMNPEPSMRHAVDEMAQALNLDCLMDPPATET